MRFFRFPDAQRQINSPEINVDDFTWYVVRTPPLREMDAEIFFRSRGYTIFCPLEMFKIRYSRYTKKKKIAEKPLIPGYVLMGFQDAPDWPKLFRFGRSLELITNVVGHNGRAMPVPECSMNWVKRMLATTSYEVVDKAYDDLNPVRLQRGDEVEIMEGPFQGLKSCVENIDKDSVQLLVTIFGRESNVKLNVDNLLKVA